MAQTQDLTVLQNLRLAYHEIERNVTRALHTQVGDSTQLGNVRRTVLRFLETAETVSKQNNHLDV